MTSVEVGVRVRPFNTRERQAQSFLVVRMPPTSSSSSSSDPKPFSGICEIITAATAAAASNPATAQKKVFHLDYCFWTHSRTSSAATDDSLPVFADQQTVYESIGKQILDNAMSGFNACLFAYGQTGSGKTYTMMGIPEDVGVIPRLVRDLYERDATLRSNDPTFSLSVECSYLEIYNEQVRDLLNAKTAGGAQQQGLRVRQHPTFGVYVEGLTKLTAKNEEDIARLLEDGGRVRAVAATNMNATSSRSHAILTLNIRRKSADVGDVVSRLHLVDLAGSERASSTGAEGETLMEGANINKSLTTLGMCLSRLAEASSNAGNSNKSSAQHVPYRDSQLTWILNDSLGGNSRTSMLANISPASLNTEETLSTMRFASTVKKIKNHAVVNEDPQQRLIRELRAEIEMIKKQIMELERSGGFLSPSVMPVGASSTTQGEERGADTDAADATGRDPLGQPTAATTAEELFEKLDEDEALMQEVMETDAEREARNQRQREELQKLTSSFRLKPLQLSKMNEEEGHDVPLTSRGPPPSSRSSATTRQSIRVVDSTVPRLMTLNEDLHTLPNVALVYYLEPGTTRVVLNGSSSSFSAEKEEPQEEAATAMHTITLPDRSSSTTIPTVVALLHVDLEQRSVCLEIPREIVGAGASSSSSPRLTAPGQPSSQSNNNNTNNSASHTIQAKVHHNGKPLKSLLPVSSATTATTTLDDSSGDNSPSLRVALHSNDRLLFGLQCLFRYSAPVNWTTTIAEDPSSSSAVSESPSQQPPPLHLVDYAFGLEEVQRYYREEHRRQREAEEQLKAAARQAEAMAELAALKEQLQREEEAKALAERQRYALAEEDGRQNLESQESHRWRDLLDVWRLVVERQTAMDLEEHLQQQAAQREYFESQEQRERLVAVLQLERSEWCEIITTEETSRTQITTKQDNQRRQQQQQLADNDANASQRRHVDPATPSSATAEDDGGAPPTTAAALSTSDANGNNNDGASGATRLMIPKLLSLPLAGGGGGGGQGSAATGRSKSPRAIGTARRLSVRQSVSSGMSGSVNLGGSTNLTSTQAHLEQLRMLGEAVRLYEAECQECRQWKPQGPTRQEDMPEYLFSMTTPTVADVCSYVSPPPQQTSSSSSGNVTARGRTTVDAGHPHDGVLHVQTVWKRKKALFGFKWHPVHVVVRTKFLYYFTDGNSATRALGASYLLGADLTSSSVPIDGKPFVLKLAPVVPRKVSKSTKQMTEENNVMMGFENQQDLLAMRDVLLPLTKPYCPPNVKEFLESSH